MPLSAADRQLLTDARIARGWSQTELADRTDGSLSFIHAIEAGKKSPSPEFLDRLCRELGLEWQCEFPGLDSTEDSWKPASITQERPLNHSAIIYRRKSNDGTLEILPRSARPVEHPSSTYFRTDGGDRYEFAFFATDDGDLIVVQADGIAPISAS